MVTRHLNLIAVTHALLGNFDFARDHLTRDEVSSGTHGICELYDRFAVGANELRDNVALFGNSTVSDESSDFVHQIFHWAGKREELSLAKAIKNLSSVDQHMSSRVGLPAKRRLT
jgi:hypothetical protein